MEAGGKVSAIDDLIHHAQTHDCDCCGSYQSCVNDTEAAEADLLKLREAYQGLLTLADAMGVCNSCHRDCTSCPVHEPNRLKTT